MYFYIIPNLKPKTYLVTDELLISNVAKMRCKYVEEDDKTIVAIDIIKNYPTINKKDKRYKEWKSIVNWTPIKTKSGNWITPVTRKEYLKDD